MESFKIRASGGHFIDGIKGLGKIGETYLKQWLKEKLYARREDIKSKYITKGNVQEEEGFTLMATELNLGMVYKNVEYFEDEYFCGTPDLITTDTVYDNKCSWSLATFPMFETEIPNQDYETQLQIYMHLTGKKKAVLCYTLIDADYFEIQRQAKWLTNPDEIYRMITNLVYTKYFANELFQEFCPTSTRKYFIEIPDNKRIKTFEINYNPEKIEKLITRVKESRNFLNNLIK